MKCDVHSYVSSLGHYEYTGEFCWKASLSLAGNRGHLSGPPIHQGLKFRYLMLFPSDVKHTTAERF